MVLYLLGDFEVTACTLWHNHQLISSDQVDDRAHLVGISDATWIEIHSSIYNAPTLGYTGQAKFEQVLVHYKHYSLLANRTELYRIQYHNQTEQRELLYAASKEWQQALVQQLDEFALISDDKTSNNWQIVWDQHPAQSIIEQGYSMAKLWESQ